MATIYDFTVTSKIDVNGAAAHPLYEFLKKSGPFAGFDESDVQAKLLKLVITDKVPKWLPGDAIKWNFTKFLMNAEGQVVIRFEPMDSMDAVQASIVQLL